jgi:hypothetical protein
MIPEQNSDTAPYGQKNLAPEGWIDCRIILRVILMRGEAWLAKLPTAVYFYKIATLSIQKWKIGRVYSGK